MSLRKKSNIIIIRLAGGLGNQMFQYAFAFALAKKLSRPFKIDQGSYPDHLQRTYELGKCFNISSLSATSQEVIASQTGVNPFFVSKFLSFFCGKYFKTRRVFQEQCFNFFDVAVDADNFNYFIGYWQSEKYFKSCEWDIKNAFKFTAQLSPLNEKYKTKILATNSVSVHVRRGDYVTSAVTSSIHGVCSLDYYTRAISIMLSKNQGLTFYVFSDDIEWCQQNLVMHENIVFIEKTLHSHDWEDMYLMSLCKHNIIANSSFSWWAAWLNSNLTKTVIAPSDWFKEKSIDTNDLIPSDWLKI